jgi:hypothetical protein
VARVKHFSDELLSNLVDENTVPSIKNLRAPTHI